MGQNHIRLRHEKRRGNAFPRNIPNKETDMIIVDGEEVIKVTTDFFRRLD